MTSRVSEAAAVSALAEREHSPPARLRRVLSKAGIYAGFSATGIGVALPGVLLPLLLTRWNLSDARGGLFLFCFFISTMIGALLSRGAMNRSVARGAALTAIGAVWLALANRDWGFAAIAVFGLGLGIAMTSTSLLVSRRWPARRRVEMMRLNLLWAAGACAGPWLGLGGHALRSATSTSRPLHVLTVLAAFFATWAVWMWVAESANGGEFTTRESGNAESGARWLILALPIPLLIVLFSATGVEASTGGWLAAYTQRIGENAQTTIGAATAFWAGLLSARFVHSLRMAQRFSERVVLSGSAILMAAGLALLIVPAAGMESVAAAFAVGFGTGPLYPLALAMALRRCESLGMFVLAGCGSAVLPLLTGTVSAWRHSLAAGLGVPLAAALIMIVMGLRMPDGRAVTASP